MNKLCLSIVAVFFCVGAVFAEDSKQQPATPSVDTKIGIEGVYYLRYAKLGLIPLAANERSPIILRISSVVKDKDTYLYEIRYIGTRPGQHDLRKYLAREDGESLGDLPSMSVAVHEVLPKEHDGAIEPLAAGGSYWAWPYRRLLQGGLILWGIATAVYFVRRFLQQRPKPVVKTNALQTLADQLLPLVNAALAGNMTTPQQARLEMLLLTHCRQKLNLAELAPDKALRQMRKNESAGRLLRELESWLHARPGTQQVDVAALLSPYRTAAAIQLEAPRLEAAVP